MTAAEHVTLVDRDDRPLGAMEKLQAHAEGRLHRAFSVFVFDQAGRLLLQRRSAAKYHSPGLWSNTCCGHPRPGEPVEAAASRRLFEEMGFRVPLRPLFRFVYRAEIGPTMVEHEVDHVLVGSFQHDPIPEPAEVQEWRWTRFDLLRQEVLREPERFTAWLRLLLQEPGHTGALVEASRAT
jgi:isopentenyl-diphosphate delta-isomerase